MDARRMEAPHVYRIADVSVTHDKAGPCANSRTCWHDDLDRVGGVNVEAVKPGRSEACEDDLATQEPLPSGQESPLIVLLSSPAVEPSR
jgi:hypothetical protein